jgi:hypothetical protein
MVVPLDNMDGLIQKRFAKAIPFYRGISVRIACIEQFPVFDKEERVDEELGELLKGGIKALWILGGIQGVAVAIQNTQAGLRFLMVDGKDAPVV